MENRRRHKVFQRKYAENINKIKRSKIKAKKDDLNLRKTAKYLRVIFSEHQTRSSSQLVQYLQEATRVAVQPMMFITSLHNRVARR